MCSIKKFWRGWASLALWYICGLASYNFDVLRHCTMVVYTTALAVSRCFNSRWWRRGPCWCHGTIQRYLARTGLDNVGTRNMAWKLWGISTHVCWNIGSLVGIHLIISWCYSTRVYVDSRYIAHIRICHGCCLRPYRVEIQARLVSGCHMGCLHSSTQWCRTTFHAWTMDEHVGLSLNHVHCWSHTFGFATELAFGWSLSRLCLDDQTNRSLILISYLDGFILGSSYRAHSIREVLVCTTDCPIGTHNALVWFSLIISMELSQCERSWKSRPDELDATHILSDSNALWSTQHFCFASVTLVSS